MGDFTPQPGIVHGTAKFVRKMDESWKGDARLYKLDPPLFGNVSTAIVSAVEDTGPGDPILAMIGQLLGADTAAGGGAETMLIPTDEDGDDYSEEGAALNREHAERLIGMVTTSTTDHAEYLAKVGYEVEA
jgi:hypothetical protein